MSDINNAAGTTGDMNPRAKAFTGFGALKEAWLFCWRTRRDLAYIAAVPVVVLSIMDALLEVSGTPDTSLTNLGMTMNTATAGTAPLTDFEVFLLVVVAITSIAFYVMFAVAWHRRYLHPTERVTVATALKPDFRKLRYLLYAVPIFLLYVIAIVLCMAGTSLLLAIIFLIMDAEFDGAMAALATMLFFVAVLFCLFYGIVRFSLALPAAAVEERPRFFAAWRRSRGHVGALVLVAVGPIIVILPVLLTVLVIMYMITSSMIEISAQMVGYFLLSLVYNIVIYAGTAFEVSALSVAYSKLQARDAAAQPTPATM